MTTSATADGMPLPKKRRRRRWSDSLPGEPQLHRVVRDVEILDVDRAVTRRVTLALSKPFVDRADAERELERIRPGNPKAYIHTREMKP